MKVCFTGIPGSGKSVLAQALAETMESVEVVDDYALDACRRIDLDYGFGGSYISNLNIALERVARERQVTADSVITCGSLLETSTYVAMDFESRQRFWNEEEKQDNAKRIQATMMMLACLYMDTFRYEKVYYLPPVGAVEDHQLQVLDRNLQAAFGAFWLTSVTPLMVEGATLEEITANRIKVINEENDGPKRASATSSES